MKSLSLASKLAFGALALAGLLVYALIVEWGMSAGHVHHGVTVAGYDVGGLTYDDLRDALFARRSLLRSEPICFESPEFNPCADPVDLAWFPDVGRTADAAYAVGRDEALWSDAADRVTAYRGGYNVPWAGHARPDLVKKLVNEWDGELEALGYTLDRGKLRFKVKRALVTYPRRTMRIPVTPS